MTAPLDEGAAKGPETCLPLASAAAIRRLLKVAEYRDTSITVLGQTGIAAYVVVYEDRDAGLTYDLAKGLASNEWYYRCASRHTSATAWFPIAP